MSLGLYFIVLQDSLKLKIANLTFLTVLECKKQLSSTRYSFPLSSLVLMLFRHYPSSPLHSTVLLTLILSFPSFSSQVSILPLSSLHPSLLQSPSFPSLLFILPLSSIHSSPISSFPFHPFLLDPSYLHPYPHILFLTPPPTCLLRLTFSYHSP